jgi:hypothetical protein
MPSSMRSLVLWTTLLSCLALPAGAAAEGLALRGQHDGVSFTYKGRYMTVKFHRERRLDPPFGKTVHVYCSGTGTIGASKSRLWPGRRRKVRFRMSQRPQRAVDKCFMYDGSRGVGEVLNPWNAKMRPLRRRPIEPVGAGNFGTLPPPR